MEAVLEVVAPAQGCHSLRSKGLCCSRGLYIQTPRVPRHVFRSRLITCLVGSSKRKGELLLEWEGKEEEIYRLNKLAYAAEYVLPPMAAFPFYSPYKYSLLVKLLPPSNFFFLSFFLYQLLSQEILKKCRRQSRRKLHIHLVHSLLLCTLCASGTFFII